MNNFAWVWGGFLPLTPYLQLRTDQVSRGAPVDFSLPAIGWQAAQIALYGGLALLLIRKSARAAAGSAAQEPSGRKGHTP